MSINLYFICETSAQRQKDAAEIRETHPDQIPVTAKLITSFYISYFLIYLHVLVFSFECFYLLVGYCFLWLPFGDINNEYCSKLKWLWNVDKISAYKFYIIFNFYRVWPGHCHSFPFILALRSSNPFGTPVQ